ncbi:MULTISPECIES: GntR family transcriptional regulator [unclassified Cryobacterium]|uniref:GntR family transcriptional regulator n=1 Tax=unclassified Cryobacterium TaxID=2649013 RepID=UPI00106C1524|nr:MULTISPECIES: GntR family transcriptional regulator [unclassified Cryobacterium]TFD02993.1 GntR family transcriptional regulator [Cryobacterium sp. TMT1-66-1]TFD15323.1 GntR family transcriptional regulator [Cryobacterium sp. TMT1-2-2]
MLQTNIDAISEDEEAELLGRLLNLDDRKNTLVGTIALTIARSIIEGRLLPEHDLNSMDLAKQFRTSRTPIREALMVLENGGLVAIPARKRPRVITLNPQQIREIYTLRSQLDAVLSDRLARTIGPDGIEVLEHTLSRMTSAVKRENVDAFFWANVLFHEQSATLAGDMTLKKALEGLGIQVLRLRHTSMSAPGRMQRSLDDHKRLLLAYRDHDTVLAPALSQSLVMGALRVLSEDATGPLATLSSPSDNIQ